MKKLPKVQNMRSTISGNPVANQFEIFDVTVKHKGKNHTGRVFQSYSTVIAFISGDLILMDSNSWNYSSTTSKYRNQFTRMNTPDTKAAIASGEIILTDLN